MLRDKGMGKSTLFEIGKIAGSIGGDGICSLLWAMSICTGAAYQKRYCIKCQQASLHTSFRETWKTQQNCIHSSFNCLGVICYYKSSLLAVGSPKLSLICFSQWGKEKSTVWRGGAWEWWWCSDGTCLQTSPPDLAPLTVELPPAGILSGQLPPSSCPDSVYSTIYREQT